MATSSFFARGDSGPANNADINVRPKSQVPTTELTFTTIDPATGEDTGDLTLEYNDGNPDGDTWVTINGTTTEFSVVLVGTVPDGTIRNGVDISNELVVVINVEGQNYFFFPENESLNTATYMDGFGQGAFDLDLIALPYDVDVCFARGTLIETPTGARPIEEIRAGDLVTTDAGPLAVAWVGSKALSGVDLLRSPERRPVRIAAGALGGECPARDLVVSPNHCVVLRGATVELAVGVPRALCAAKHLVGRPGITSETPAEGIEYFHILFSTHRIVTSEGLESESLSHGPRAREALGDALCDRLIAEGVMREEEGRSPLPVLRRFEALALA